jgi:hypothetical protein
MHKGVLAAIIVVAVIVVACGAWVGAAYGVTRAMGPVVTEDRSLSPFTKIDVSGRGTLFITQGSTPTLRIEARQGILDRLKTRVSGDTLEIGYRSHWLGLDVLWEDEAITYHLTVPDLAAVKLSGAIVVKGEGTFAAGQFAIDCSGSSDVTLDVRAENLSLDTSGSSEITLAGQVDTFICDTSGSTEIFARNLVSRIASVDCSGSSDIEVNASERLTVNASGSSTVSHVGTPILATNISGSGEVRQLSE